MHRCIPTPTTDSNTSTGMIWVTHNMDRSAANRQGNVMELSGNFTLSGEWSPCEQVRLEYSRGVGVGEEIGIYWRPSVPKPHPARKPQCAVCEIAALRSSCSSRTWVASGRWWGCASSCEYRMPAGSCVCRKLCHMTQNSCINTKDQSKNLDQSSRPKVVQFETGPENGSKTWTDLKLDMLRTAVTLIIQLLLWNVQAER